MRSTSELIITSGISTSALLEAVSTRSSRSAISDALNFSAAVFSLSLVRSSSRVSTSSSISLANSSLSSGISFPLTSFTFTSNTAGFPASSAAWYSSGNVISIDFSSPTFIPTICSSKPGMNEPDPTSSA